MIKLSSRYDRDDFLKFLEENFLVDFEKDIRPVSTEGSPSIQKAYSLGKSKSLDLQVFEFSFEGSAKKRVTLTKDAFQVMKSRAIFRALAIFHSPNSDDWRLSLMTATPERSEKGKVAITYSNPKRLSFFLGPNAKVNTPTKFILQRGNLSDYEDLKSRFSIEVVNKEFYKEISKLFTQLVGGSVSFGQKSEIYKPLLKLPSIPDKSQISLEFAVRLIGRVIFCWFLREKKSGRGKSLMPNELLSLEAVKRNSDYYHNILEPVFFEVLNKPVKTRKELLDKEPFSSIPYLNGGLFSPQEDDFFSYNESKQATYHNTVVIPDEWILKFFGVLETYNFTIDENTGFDEELSIDPEMLGRIFENLLAEINPETGESARKSTGSYYTPRVIVDYMVDESLLLYLKNKTGIDEEKLRRVISYDLNDDVESPLNDDERERIINALDKVKILDPACGSGAFPIGELQKIVFILQQADPEGHLWFKKQIKNMPPEIKRVVEREFKHKNFDYIRKLGIIRENIYGIDIQPIATEISRLRCFLTLIVDERIQEDLENRGIEPLPNLDFKFVTANSLTGLPKLNDSAQSELFDDRENINELKYIRDQYFNASGIEREQLKTEFVLQQKKLIDQLIKEHGFIGATKAELTQKLTDWEPFSHKPTSWFEPEWMFGIGDGFDIVIANPPYIGFHGIKDIRNELTKNFRSAKGKFDLYLVFIEQGLQLVKNGRYVIFICPTNFMKRSHGETLRELLALDSKIIEVIDFGHQQIFDAVTNYTGIFLFEKVKPNANHRVRYKNNLNNYSIIEYNQSHLGKKSWVFRAQDFKSIIEKAERHKKLSELSEAISEGIVTGLNTLYLLSLDEIKVSGFELTYFRKCVRGKEVRKNTLLPSDFFVFYPYEEQGNKTKVIEEKVFKQKCPNYYSYLEFNKNKIMKRDYFMQSSKLWYELWNPRNIPQFNKEKILTPELSPSNNFAFAQNEYFYGDTVCGITLKNNSPISLLALLAILNSKLIEFVYQSTTVPKAGGFYIYKVMFLKDIPIAIPDEVTASKLEQLQLALVNLNRSDYSIEEEIDRLVYKLYDLTEDEMRLVEGMSNKRGGAGNILVNASSSE
ncbi:MAG: Eco57I restriction-modification methylase domain-containing protein [Ktedonobacteraceae bacterium]